MRYWVFTEEQLERALEQHATQQDTLGATVFKHQVRQFLDSDAAKANKLQGGASYEPNKDQ